MGYLLEVIFYEMLKICKGKTSNNKKIFFILSFQNHS